MTPLSAGCQVLVAPHFPPVADWAGRLRLSAGVTIQGDHAWPREPWREPAAAELSLLVRDPSLPLTQANLDAALALLTLPRHLLAAWWQLLEQASSTGGLLGFDGFLRRVCEFLAFKSLLPAGGLSADVLACPPGQPSLRNDPRTNAPAGLGWSARLWGLVNLGAEASEVTFLNRAAGNPERAAALLESEPDYPLVALRLEPGEGCRFPVAGILVDGHAVGKETPDLWLLLRS